MNISKQSERYKVMISCLIGIVALGVLLVISFSQNPRELKKSEVQTLAEGSGNYGMNVNAPPAKLTFTLDSRSLSSTKSKTSMIPLMGKKKYVAVPPLRLYNNSMLSMKEKEMSMIDYANLETRVVLNIRKLAEDALSRNPEMSSGAIVDLLMEQIQEDVFDGWDPDANKVQN